MIRTLIKFATALPPIIGLLVPAFARSEVPVQAWVQRYSRSSNTVDQAWAVAVDQDNNAIVTGGSATIKYSPAGMPLWTNLYLPGVARAVAVDGSNDIAVTGNSMTIKYSSGGAALWTNFYPSGAAYAIAVDRSKNVIVTGDSAGNYATIKYSPVGQPLWTNRYDGAIHGADRATAVVVDGDESVIVTGYVFTRSLFPYDAYAYITIKYAGDGTPLWTNRYSASATSDDQASALAVDSDKNIIVTGASGILGFYDYATVKYSSTGVPLWTNRSNYSAQGNTYNYARALAVDLDNAVIVTGYVSDSGLNYHYVTVKYSNAGVPLWTNRYTGVEGRNDIPAGVVVDHGNNVIVTGWSAGGATSNDCATIKYTSAGIPLWTNRYNGPMNRNDFASGVAVDANGNIIVSGYSDGTDGSYDFVTMKYICVPEPVLTGLQLTNGAFQLRVDGLLQPGTLVIETSSNLTTWVPAFTNAISTNVLYYTDPNSSHRPSSHYRAFQFP